MHEPKDIEEEDEAKELEVSGVDIWVASEYAYPPSFSVSRYPEFSLTKLSEILAMFIFTFPPPVSEADCAFPTHS